MNEFKFLRSESLQIYKHRQYFFEKVMFGKLKCFCIESEMQDSLN